MHENKVYWLSLNISHVMNINKVYNIENVSIKDPFQKSYIYNRIGDNVNKSMHMLNGNIAKLNFCFNNMRGGLVENKMAEVDDMISKREPDILGGCEAVMTQLAADLLLDKGYVVEEFGEGERIWVAISETIKYKRRTDREFQRLGDYDSRKFKPQRQRWKPFVDRWEEVLNLGQECCVIGDFNLNLFSWQQQGNTKNWNYQKFVDYLYNKVMSKNVTQLIDKITRSQGGTDSCLDLIFTNRPEKVRNTVITDTSCSDHKVITIVRGTHTKSTPTQIQKRDWKNVDWRQVREDFKKKKR